MIRTMDEVTLAVLEARLRTILPPEYQETYEEVQPVSMGSAGLVYGSDGRVAWNEMWKSFCDLAMAGGPPHRGTLLEPGLRSEIEGQAGRYRQVVEEICRGITLVTGLEAAASRTAGWVRVECAHAAMAGWLVRAIVMENISCRYEGTVIFLPGGPGYRMEKEIKNVVTVMAKTCHYWLGHMPLAQQEVIADVFAEEPLVQVGHDGDGAWLAGAIHRETGLRASNHAYAGWLGLECADVRAAIWMMRMMVASHVISRREGTVVFVPVGPESVLRQVVRVYGFAKARGVL
ncbi:hypothetical protein SAMN05421771_1317 [Granulicella pectinivorans]|uniref:Uncharacterized protein n=1 Tax=Granulicella pectinivorans TaxID=474950 RepID=A0A1I6LV15_9BACT|nr:hypothetical protein [Granulicella pectinivorans]SFS07293.1 hypothetical protein SAMN05421771_1317 [Granulicella pectinivorans]